jgi:hypothetical protein
MKLFTIDNLKPTISPEGLIIKQFKDIWDSDKSKDKKIAIAKLAYVYFSMDYKSIYLSYTKEIRDQRLGEDLMDNCNYKPEQDVLVAMSKYDELQQTPTMNFLKAARCAQQATENYFMSVDYTERDSKNNPIYKGPEVTKMLKDCAGIKDALDKLEDAVKKEQSNGNIARGGGIGGLFETSDD